MSRHWIEIWTIFVAFSCVEWSNIPSTNKWLAFIFCFCIHFWRKMALIAEGKVLLSSDTFPQHGAPLRTLCLLSVRAGQPCGLWVCTLQQKASTSAPNSVIYRAWGNYFFALHCICRHGWTIRILPISKALQVCNCSVKNRGRNLDGKGESNFVCHSKLSSWNVKFGFEDLIWNTDFEGIFWPTAGVWSFIKLASLYPFFLMPFSNNVSYTHWAWWK